MKKKDISLEILYQLLNQVPDNLDISAIDLTNDTYKLKFSMEYEDYREESFKSSLEGLIGLIKELDD